MKTEIPQDLAALTVAELQALVDSLLEEFKVISDEAAGAPSEEQLTELETIADGIKTVRAQITTVEAQAAVRAQRAEDLLGEVAPAQDPEDCDDGGPGEEEPAAEEPVEEEVLEPESVTAASRPPLSRVKSAQPKTPAPRRKNNAVTIVASAGTGAMAPGEQTDWLGVAQIIEKRRAGIPQTGEHIPIAAIRLEYPEGLVASGGPSVDATAILDAAADESTLPGGSLIAAGGVGWAAPSEIDYSIPESGASLDGLVSVPEIGVSRGGIQFYRGISFADVAGFIQTEAQNISGALKVAQEVPVPTANEVRLTALGFAVKSGILQQVGWPETIAQFLAETAIGHQHSINKQTLLAMVSGSTAVTIPSTNAASASILAALELQAIDLRYKYRLAEDETLEVKLPYWAKAVLRADFAMRNGIDDPFNVTDAQLVSWFAVRGCAVQFVYDWQDMGSTAPTDALPLSLKALIYRAGTWVRGLENVVNISALYDSSLLLENKQLAAFFEQGFLVAKRGHESRAVTLPLVIDGATGGQIAIPED